MREILYKAKRLDNGEWVEGNLIYSNTKSFIVCAYETLCNDGENTDFYATEWYEVDPKTICRYTGLTDKNGNKIWENDRVVKADEPEISGTVKFGLYKGFYIVWSGSCAYRQDICYWANDGLIEVIGNICDNKELLESK